MTQNYNCEDAMASETIPVNRFKLTGKALVQFVKAGWMTAH